MTLHKLKTVEKEDNVKVYARDPKDIIEVVKIHREEARKQGVLEDPKLYQWIKKEPTTEDIIIVDNGAIHFQAGGIDFSGDNKESFFQQLKITPDFTVHINE